MSKEAPKAAGGRKNQNVVEVNAQWREAVKKEMEHHNLNEHFDFNPKKRNIHYNNISFVISYYHHRQASAEKKRYVFDPRGDFLFEKEARDFDNSSQEEVSFPRNGGSGSWLGQ